MDNFMLVITTKKSLYEIIFVSKSWLQKYISLSEFNKYNY
jgi:hypothetical protein